LRTLAVNSIRLRPGGKRRTPRHATLVAMHHESARQGVGGALLTFQRVIECSVENSQQRL
jgi:hypothetical protein